MSLRTLTLVMRVLAPIPILVGLVHLFFGVRAEALLGAKVPSEVLAEPSLNSQDRFYGVVFMGSGLLLFLCAADPRKYAAVFQIVIGVILLGGVARIVSVVQYGWPAPMVTALLAIEVVGMPLALWWHARVLAAPND